MATRSIASLSISFGLVAIPVKVYLATESAAAVTFKLMGSGGSRLRQQYVSDAPAESSREEPGGEAEAIGAAEVRADPVTGRVANANAKADAAADADADADAGADVDVDVDSDAGTPSFETAVLREVVPAGRVPDEAAAPTAVAPTPVLPQRGREFQSRSINGAAAPSPSGGRPGWGPVTSPPEPAEAPRVVERSEMLRGYEFERGQFVLFTTAELKALAAQSRQTIDIVAFTPTAAVDPIYYEKAYFLAPDKGGAKPYGLLLAAMRETGQSALAKWAWRAKEYVVQIRPTDDGLVLQQLFYAEEVRALSDLKMDRAPVTAPELQLAKQIIGHLSVPSYDPSQFIDEEKARILAAVDRKIAGRQIVSPEAGVHPVHGAQVLDLMAALRASLSNITPAPAPAAPGPAPEPTRKPMRRAPKSEPAPVKTRRANAR